MSKPVAGLIACCKKKKDRPCKAVDLYTSTLFSYSLKFCTQRGLSVYILSAKYRMIKGDKIIYPYDKTLLSMEKEEIDQWEQCVASQVKNEFGSSPLLVLAGSKYLGFSKLVENPIIDPLRGMGIGVRLSWLKNQTKATR